MGTHYRGTPAEMDALDCYIKLSRAADAVGSRVNDHLSDYDLTVSQFGALEALYHLGPLPVGQLGHKILRSSGNMTLVIDNLVRRQLVQRRRREDDRRCIEVSLTATGQELISRIWPGHVIRVVAAFDPLSDSELESLAGLCRTLGRAQELREQE